MMDYVMLWLLAMVTCLLFTALAAALFSFYKKGLWRHLWMFVIVGVLAFLFGIVSLLSGLMYFNNLIIPFWLFPYAVSFALLYLVASIVIWREGLVTKADTPPARAWRRGVLASCLFLGIVLTMTTYTLIDVRRQIEFSNVNADLKTSLQEIWPSKPLPHLNAYPLYELASDAITNQDKVRVRNYNEPDRQPTKHEIMELIDRNLNVIDILHTASQRPLCFWGRPVEANLVSLFSFPQFPNYRVMTGLLGLKAKMEALSGDPAGAFEELAAIRSMAEHVLSSPDLISFMYSWAVTKQEHDIMEYVLAHTHSVDGLFDFPKTAKPSVFQSCERMLINESSMEVQFPFLMMQNEKVIEKVIRTYNEMNESIGRAPSIVLPYLLHPLTRSLWRVFIGRSYVVNVKNMWEKNNQFAEPGYKHWRDFHLVKEELKGIRQSLFYDVLNDFGGIIGSDDHLGLSPYINRLISIDVYRQLMDLAVTACAYLEAEGSYPYAVDDLVPGFLKTVPIDPYTGKPFKIKAVPGGLDIYSTGPDPEDLVSGSTWGGPMHFYLGREAYEKYRVEPAKQKRVQEESKRKELERKRIEREKLRKSGAAPVLKKKRKPKNRE